MVSTRTPTSQQGDSVLPEQPAEVVYLWREILLQEPDTNPWEFACKMAKSGFISTSEVWNTAEWADQIREGVRTLRSIQAIESIRVAPLSV